MRRIRARTTTGGVTSGTLGSFCARAYLLALLGKATGRSRRRRRCLYLPPRLTGAACSMRRKGSAGVNHTAAFSLAPSRRAPAIAVLMAQGRDGHAGCISYPSFRPIRRLPLEPRHRLPPSGYRLYALPGRQKSPASILIFHAGKITGESSGPANTKSRRAPLREEGAREHWPGT